MTESERVVEIERLKTLATRYEVDGCMAARNIVLKKILAVQKERLEAAKADFQNTTGVTNERENQNPIGA